AGGGNINMQYGGRSGKDDRDEDGRLPVPLHTRSPFPPRPPVVKDELCVTFVSNTTLTQSFTKTNNRNYLVKSLVNKNNENGTWSMKVVKVPVGTTEVRIHKVTSEPTERYRLFVSFDTREHANEAMRAWAEVGLSPEYAKSSVVTGKVWNIPYDMSTSDAIEFIRKDRSEEH